MRKSELDEPARVQIESHCYTKDRLSNIKLTDGAAAGLAEVQDLLAATVQYLTKILRYVTVTDRSLRGQAKDASHHER